jgi:hypothetical protein
MGRPLFFNQPSYQKGVKPMTPATAAQMSFLTAAKGGHGSGGRGNPNPFVTRIQSPVYVTTFGGKRWVYMLIPGVTSIGGRGEQFFNDPVEPFVGHITLGLTSRGIPPTDAFIYDGTICEMAWDATKLGGASGDDITVNAFCNWILPRPYTQILTIG